MFVSVVIPIFNNSQSIEILNKEIISSFPKNVTSFEIIYVDDGSIDESWEKLIALSHSNKGVKGIKLSRNYGQDNAISAGLARCTGDVAIVMDGDGQDDPKYFEQFIKNYNDGFEVILARKINREFSRFRNLFTNLFFFIFHLLQENQHEKTGAEIGAYSLLSRKAIDTYLSVDHPLKRYLMQIKIIGFKRAFVDVVHRKRKKGVSQYSFLKLAKVATTSWVIYSNRLIDVLFFVGFVQFFISLISMIFIVYNFIANGSVEGWSSLMFSIFFCSALLQISLAILGKYTVSILALVKPRMLFVEDTVLGFE